MVPAVIRVIEWTIIIEKWTFDTGRYKTNRVDNHIEKWTFGNSCYKGDRVDNQYRELDVWNKPL